MDKLLRFEFRKLFGRKVMGILSGLTLGNILFNALFYVSLLSDGAYTVTLSDIVSQVSLIIINNYLSLFAVIFVSLILCDDYSNRTMKNIVSRGYSRISIFFSKYIVTIIALLIMFAALFIVGSFLFLLVLELLGADISFIFAGFAASMKDFMILERLAVCFAIVSIISFFALVIKKSGGVIAIGIVLYAFSGVPFIILQYKLPKVAEILQNWFPYFMTATEEFKNAYLCSALYFAVFTGLCVLVAHRSEVKN